MIEESERARCTFRQYRDDAEHDPTAAERWRYWTTLARLKSLKEAGASWKESAELLGIDVHDKATWSMRLGDRRVKVAQEVLDES